jgi:glycosyltransferase involved in cell wall biosynthesis/SAM-dependent methyltransferase
MFDGKYHEWNQKRIKNIIDHYGYKFFLGKKVLDLGCGYCDIGGALYRLGSEVTAVDARQEHLKIVNKKYPGIKTVQSNLDGIWPFHGQKYDLILDLGLICHLNSVEKHLQAVCASTTYLVLETAVCDSSEQKCPHVPEGKNIYDLSFNGMGCRPTAALIEKILREAGMDFRRMDKVQFNAYDSNYKYDWMPEDNNSTDLNKRRIWFAVKTSPGIVPAIWDQQPTNQATHSNMGFAAPIQNSGIPVILRASPKPPQTHAPGVNLQGPTQIYYEKDKRLAMAMPSYTPPPDSTKDKRFVIVIPSYKNEEWCEKNMTSALNQNYKSFRIIFTDDCSPDKTFEKVNALVNRCSRADQVTLIKNDTRIGALANLYNMIHSCEDDEIVLTLDGDDWFPDGEVLNTLNAAYSDNNTWITYGQYKNSNDGGRGVAAPYPDNVVLSTSFRKVAWGASHLRTFYAWLFKSIKKEDLMWQGSFFPMTWDFAMMFPMLEMAGPHSRFLNDTLYVYNLDNPINDHKVNVNLQHNLDAHIRAMPKYQIVQSPPVPSVGLMMIATGKYDKFIQGLISSADAHFMKNGYEVIYYVFSDKQPSITSSRKVVYIPIEHKPFPFASMDRFKHFTNHADILTTNYLYYVDVDCSFVSGVATEVLGNLVGVRHCGFYNAVGPYETNPNSCLYVQDSQARYRYYFGGGFSGGRRNSYLHLSKWCSDHIEEDVAKGIIPIWHDETALNRYFLDHQPDVVLSPSYHYPQSNVARYRKNWDQDFPPKIMLLDKDHQVIRTT